MEKRKESPMELTPEIMWPVIALVTLAFFGGLGGPYLGMSRWISGVCMVTGAIWLWNGCDAYLVRIRTG